LPSGATSRGSGLLPEEKRGYNGSKGLLSSGGVDCLPGGKRGYNGSKGLPSFGVVDCLPWQVVTCLRAIFRGLGLLLGENKYKLAAAKGCFPLGDWLCQNMQGLSSNVNNLGNTFHSVCFA